MDGSQDTFSSLQPDDSADGIPSQAIAAYWTGEGTGEDHRVAEAWLKEHAALGHVLRKAWDLSAYRHEAADLEQAWSLFQRRQGDGSDQHLRFARRSSAEVAPRRGFKAQPLRYRALYMLAGATLAVLTIVVGWRVDTAERGARIGKPVLAYVTGKGERANITLPDGNTVALDVESRVEVPADYLAGDHTLRLNGEALFVIQHHVGSPITVVAGQTAARVLGTSFAVRHYTTDTSTTVAVREGKVAVGGTVVMANRSIDVGRNGMVTLRPATPSQFSFAAGTLTLVGLYLPAAIPELNRWYNADIRLGDPVLAKRGVGGQFSAGSLADLAANLEVTLNVRVVRDGRVLTLYPRR